MNKQDFLNIESKNRRVVKVSMIYIDMTDDLTAGLLLSQIIYWFLPKKNGELKTRIHKEGHDWIAKKREEWWREIRITPKQYDRAIGILLRKELVILKIFRFNGSPTTHIALDWKRFLSLYKDRVQFNNENEYDQRGNGNSPLGKFEIDERGNSITETTTETTTEKFTIKDSKGHKDLKGNKILVKGINKKRHGDLKTSQVLGSFRKIWGEPIDKKPNWEASNLAKMIYKYTEDTNRDFLLTLEEILSEIKKNEWGGNVMTIGAVRRHAKKIIEDRKNNRSKGGYEYL